MANPKHPDVYVSEFSSPNRSLAQPSTTTAAFVGSHWRGPNVARRVRSWSEFLTYFGGFSTTTVYYLPFAVYRFFANGGRDCYVSRTGGTGMVAATATLNDRTGSPIATLRIDAKDGGVWGNNIRIDIVDRDSPNGRFDIIVKNGGTADANVVEKWVDVSMNNLDARYAVDMLNNPDSGSTWVTLTDLNSTTVAPNDTPAAATGTALTTGADGAAPSNGQVQAAVTVGTSPLDAVLGVLTLNLPAESTAANLNAAIAYAEARGNVFVVIDPPQNTGASAAVTFNGTLTVSSYAAVYGPWGRVSDPASSTAGALRWLPPGGAVAGKIAETDVLRGVFKAPAGTSVTMADTVALETYFAPTDLDTLNEASFNVLRKLPGVGIAIMGSRTLKKTAGDKYVPIRRTLNYVKQAILDGTLWTVFEPNDFTLWATIEVTVGAFLTQFWKSGGLAGTTANAAYYVKCDSENNTPTTVQQGIVNIEVGIAPQYPAEFVVFKLALWQGGGSVGESA